MSRLHPRQRGLVMTLLIVTQVSLCVPSLRGEYVDWLREPRNPMWFFIALWFSIFTFIAIPSSILLGGLCGANSEGRKLRLLRRPLNTDR